MNKNIVFVFFPMSTILSFVFLILNTIAAAKVLLFSDMCKKNVYFFFDKEKNLHLRCGLIVLLLIYLDSLNECRFHGTPRGVNKNY